MTLDDFLHDHLILSNPLPTNSNTFSIQAALMSGTIVTEVVVDNPLEFIEVVLQNGYFVSCMTWWDRVKIDEGSPIGMGGPRDPRNPNTYYFSEVVHLDKYFDELTTKEVYCEYIEDILSAYPRCDLYPGFDIKKRVGCL